jgi:hypothetical protein
VPSLGIDKTLTAGISSHITQLINCLERWRPKLAPVYQTGQPCSSTPHRLHVSGSDSGTPGGSARPPWWPGWPLMNTSPSALRTGQRYPHRPNPAPGILHASDQVDFLRPSITLRSWGDGVEGGRHQAVPGPQQLYPATPAHRPLIASPSSHHSSSVGIPQSLLLRQDASAFRHERCQQPHPGSINK